MSDIEDDAGTPARAGVQPGAADQGVIYAVLNENRGDLRSGQVVFGTAAQVAALGDGARAATPADISVSAPSHFPLEP